MGPKNHVWFAGCEDRTYYGVYGHLQFIRENLSYRSPILLRTTGNTANWFRDGMGIPQEGAYKSPCTNTMAPVCLE
jgi:hypothetical protein